MGQMLFRYATWLTTSGLVHVVRRWNDGAVSALCDVNENEDLIDEDAMERMVTCIPCLSTLTSRTEIETLAVHCTNAKLRNGYVDTLLKKRAVLR